MIDADAMQARMRLRQVEERRQIAEKLRIPPVDVAPRLPRETDREYGKRLAQEAMRLCDEGTKALRRMTKPEQPEPHEPTEPEPVS